MDKNELQKNIALYYSKLTPPMQEFFGSMGWLESLKTIASEYTLTNEEIEALSTETTLVLLGVIHPDEYEETIKTKLGLPQNSADKIYEEVNKNILEKNRAQLVEIFTRNSQPGATGDEQVNMAEQELDERFSNVSPEIRKAINESDYQKTIYNIGQEQKLNIEQINKLEMSTVDVILGNTPTDKLSEKIKNSLNIDAEKSAILTSAINERILKKIRGIMMAPAQPTINSNELPAPSTPTKTTPTPDTQTAHTGTPAPASNVLAQKLSGSFQIPATNTEHKLENISKPATPAVPVAPKAYPPKADPYRLSPDE